MFHRICQPASMRLCLLPWLVAPILSLGGSWDGQVLLAQDDAFQEVDDASSSSGNTAQATPLPSSWSADLADLLRPSIVEVSYLGREGKPEGVGTGVVIDSEQGLIATNLHVIGEAREIVVKTDDGQLPQVQQVWASDPQLDLAILKVRANGLSALSLGDSDDVRDGQPVLAIGNPHGLRNSVVAGVSSGKRVMDGKKLIQLAMPIEPGNSGGPLVTQDGKLVGIVSLKSNVTNNLGFAVEVNQLKELLERPNSIDIDRWLTIGALDTNEWETLGGATWRQRGGMIIAEGLGEGFGGRSLCLTKQAALQVPFELAVDVRLDDESGAAGLVFSSDGGDRHYGFYPSQSALRFSRFDGPTVFQWKVIQQQQSPHYREGEWNRLKVRCEEEGQFICSVNDRVVFRIQDRQLQGTRIGVAKFRDTRAQFRSFQVAGSIPDRLPGRELEQQLLNQIGTLPNWRELKTDALQDFRGESLAAQTLLERQARQLENQAAELRKVRQQLHLNDCLEGLRKVVESKDLDPLIPGALWIARIDDPDLVMAAYQNRLQKIKEELLGRIEPEMTSKERLVELNEYLFQENGFHGSRTDYYHRANSYLNRVIDDREGIPLTLSILYRELAAVVGVEMQGIGLPGHFLLQWTDPEGRNHWIDAFENGRELPRDEVVKLGVQAAGYWDEEFLAPVDSRQMLIRLLSNLRGIAESERSMGDLEKYVEALLVLEPDSVAYRGMRAVVRFENGRLAAALEDLDWVVQNPSPGIDLSTVLRMRQQFAERLDLERGADREVVEDEN